MKKSQITFFLAFILVIFFIVGFFLFQVSKVSVDKIADPSPVDAQALYYMVSNCFDAATDRALLLTARSGGYIHDPNFGFYAPNNSGKYGQNVTPYILGNNYTFTGYGVRRSDGANELPLAPGYPYIGFLIPNPGIGLSPSNPSHKPIYFNYAPQNYNKEAYELYLMPLCFTHGKNSFYFGLALSSCLTYSSGNNPRLQTTMEDYAKKYLINCTEEAVKREYGYTTIDLEFVNLDSYIGETDVVFYLNYPVNFGNKVETYIFTSRKNARLKHAYEIAAGMIKEDAKNVFFDMANKSHVSKVNVTRGVNIEIPLYSILLGFDIRRIKNACYETNLTFSNIECEDDKWKFSDVILINDTRSSLSGEQMVFAFAVENRRPALDLIKRVNNEYYDIITFSGAPLRIVPEAYDPDQDYHTANCIKGPCMGQTYIYSGWKADYEEIFNFTLPDGNISLENVTGIINLTGFNLIFDEPINITKPINSSGDILLPLNKNIYKTNEVSCSRGDDLGGVDSCLGNANQWHASNQYSSTNRIAEITTTLQDAGPHVVRVKVKDREGLFDYQDIRILIKPLMGGGFSPFVSQDDIDPEHASWEDPYTLSIQYPLFPEFNNKYFTWNDTCSNVLLGNGTISGAYEYANITFDKDIKDPEGLFNFSNNLSLGFDSCPHQKRIEFTIYDSYPNDINLTLNFPLNLSQCLPYDSTGSNVFPFKHGDEILGKSHVCCNHQINNWGTYKDENIVCYNHTKNYAFIDLANNYNSAYESASYTFTNPIFPANLTYTSKTSFGYPSVLVKNNSIKLVLIGDVPDENLLRNDIISRTFVQYCSGDRGNVCSGEAKDEGEVIQCNDYNTSKGEIARCQWPCDPENDNNCNKNDVTSADIGPGCYNFEPSYINGKPISNMSFEKDFLFSNNPLIQKGFCNPMLKCSSSYDTYNDTTSGYYLNKGICGNDGYCSAGFMVEKCSDLSGYSYNSSRVNNRYYYHKQGCISSGDYLTDDNCGPIGLEDDLDDSKELCEGAKGEYTPDVFNCDSGDGNTSCWVQHFEDDDPLPGQYTGPAGQNFHCCGDDANEKFSYNYTDPIDPSTLIRGCCSGNRIINATGQCDDP